MLAAAGVAVAVGGAEWLTAMVAIGGGVCWRLVGRRAAVAVVGGRRRLSGGGGCRRRWYLCVAG